MYLLNMFFFENIYIKSFVMTLFFIMQIDT